MLEIKRATAADIPLIRALSEQVWPQTYIPIIGAEQVSYMLNLFYSEDSLKQQLAEGHTFLVCSRDGMPAGFASYSDTGGGIFKLHKLYVATAQQGHGIGRFMLDFILEDLKRMGGSALRLNVNRYNHPAIAFYTKTGFTQVYDEDIDIGYGFFMNDHVLERDLGPLDI